MRPSTNALQLVAALAAGTGCAKAIEPQRAPASTGMMYEVASEPLILSIDARADAVAVDPRAQALMQWVHPLKKGAQTTCSATHIGPRALLTAAHCVDGDDPAIPAIENSALATLPLNRRACAHDRFGSCADAFPVGEYSRLRDDVATVWLDQATTLTNAPLLGRVGGYGDVPSAFMLSALSGRPHPVCNASASGEVGTSAGLIEKGDSGSAIVALRADNVPVIVGVVSHRWESQGRWFFAVMPRELPWPTAAPSPAPRPDHYYDSDFSPIQDCQ